MPFTRRFNKQAVAAIVLGSLAATGPVFAYNGLFPGADPYASEMNEHMQAMHDVLQLDFKRMLAHPEEHWVVMHVAADDMSGGGIMRKSGDVIYAKGKWTVIDVLTSAPKVRSGAYYWERPWLDSDQREVWNFSPFEYNGGFMVARVDDDRHDASQFDQALLLPFGWEKFVTPAWNYFKTKASMFDVANAATNTKQLRELTTQDNPILEMMARQTLPDGGMDGGLTLSWGDPATAADVGAMRVCCLLKSNSAKRWPALLGVIRKAIHGATTPEELKGVLMGMIDAQTQGSSYYDRLDAVSPMILKKEKRLGKRGAADKFIRGILAL